MQVATSHHIDASDQRDDGLYDYYYEYDLWVFTEGEVALVARGYADTPSEATLLRLEVDGQHKSVLVGDLAIPLVKAAAAYLREIGKSRIRWYNSRNPSGGYEPIPDTV